MTCRDVLVHVLTQSKLTFPPRPSWMLHSHSPRSIEWEAAHVHEPKNCPGRGHPGKNDDWDEGENIINSAHYILKMFMGMFPISISSTSWLHLLTYFLWAVGQGWRALRSMWPRLRRCCCQMRWSEGAQRLPRLWPGGVGPPWSLGRWQG